MAARRDLIVGLDLGQAADPSALAVVERRPSADGRKYAVLALQRWHLGTSYVAIVDDLRRQTTAEERTQKERPPLERSVLVVDGTGVGRAVVDLIRDEKLSVTMKAAIITSGHAESFVDGFHHIAKVILVGTLQVLLQQRRLRFAKGMPDTPVLVKELENYRTKVTPALNETFNAREGGHDDLVLALALACWWGERSYAPPRTFRPRTLRGGHGVGGAEGKTPAWFTTNR